MPKLSEVHVECEVHVLLGQVADGEDVEGDPDRDGDAAVVGSDPLVVSDHELVEDGGDIHLAIPNVQHRLRD